MFTDENWRGKMQGASAEIDRRFGESFFVACTIKRPNRAPEPSDVPPFEIQGVFSHRSGTAFKNIYGQSGGTIVETRVPIVTISHRACPYALQNGDVLTRVVDGTQWEVTKVAPDGVARIVLDLTQRGQAIQ